MEETENEGVDNRIDKEKGGVEGVELLRNAKNIGNEMETYDEAVILYRGYWILA